MSTFLLFDAPVWSPEMRHEIAEAVMDRVVFIEHDGARIVVGSVLDEPVFRRREDVVDEFWSDHDLGMSRLYKDDSFPEPLLQPELVFRAVARAGVSSVVVPPSFHVQVADYLRDRGIDVVVDGDAWGDRRRRKTPWELEGIERAQRAAETAMLVAVRMLSAAEPTPPGQLRFEGEILTAELIRESMIAELVNQGAECEDILVQSGDACLRGHDVGSGPILPNQSCIIDCYPRDRKSGCFTDMTRTFVPGSPSDELKRLHRDCRAALEIAFDSIKPGADDVPRKVAEYLEAQGYPTYLSWEQEEPLREGMTHSIGHGVGLDVHEKPRMGRRADELAELDVIAVEPGLYFEGIGGVRLEDTVVVTDAGIEHFTDPYPYDLQP